MGNTPPRQQERHEQEVPWAWIKRVRELTDPLASSASSANKEASLPVEILPWLLLSDEKNARDVAKLKRLGVTHVLSLNGTTQYEAKRMKESLESAGIGHRRVSGDDSEGYDMIGKHWDECRDFIKDARDDTEDGRVVVHCVAGINRSGLIACSAHMCFERETVLNVVEHCVNRRGMVLWNRSFQKQLCLLAAEEGLLGIKPTGYNDDPIVSVGAPPPPAHEALGRLF